MSADSALGEARPQANITARTIVDTNYGITNILEIKEARTQIINALKKFEDVLIKHCGPLSGYAMLIDQNSLGENFQPSIFTRDGIQILRTVDMVSPLEGYIKNILAYIGTRVDNYAKDGTTTSMLFAARFLRIVLSHVEDLPKFSNYKTNQLLEEVITKFNNYLKELTFDVNKWASKPVDLQHPNKESIDFEIAYRDYLKDPVNHPRPDIRIDIPDNLSEAEQMKLAGEIAFCQALSSSGGDLELARVMQQIFEASPPVSWEFITFNNSPKETDKLFIADVPEHDIKFPASPCLPGAVMYNHALQTEYLQDDVRVAIVLDPLSDGDLVTEKLIKYLEDYPGDKPIMVIAPAVDPGITFAIRNMNMTREEPVRLWMYQGNTVIASQTYAWELMIAAAICGEEPYNKKTQVEDKYEDINTFMTRKVHYHDGTMYLYSSVEPLKDTCLHPYYVHPEQGPQYYQELVKSLKTQIDLYTNGHKPDGRTLTYFMEMLNKLVCIHRPTLLLGGTTHDQVASAPVAQDVLGAIMSSLKHGALINGCYAAYLAINRTYRYYTYDDNIGNYEDLTERKFKGLISHDLMEALAGVVQATYCDRNYVTKVDPTDKFDDDTKKCIPTTTYLDSHFRDELGHRHLVPEVFDNIFTDGLNSLWLFREEQLNTDDAVKDYPVMHPVAIYQEMMRRVQEMLLKVILTNQIIIHGGVVLNKEEEDKHGS